MIISKFNSVRNNRSNNKQHICNKACRTGLTVPGSYTDVIIKGGSVVINSDASYHIGEERLHAPIIASPGDTLRIVK